MEMLSDRAPQLKAKSRCDMGQAAPMPLFAQRWLLSDFSGARATEIPPPPAASRETPSSPVEDRQGPAGLGQSSADNRSYSSDRERAKPRGPFPGWALQSLESPADWWPAHDTADRPGQAGRAHAPAWTRDLLARVDRAETRRRRWLASCRLGSVVGNWFSAGRCQGLIRLRPPPKAPTSAGLIPVLGSQAPAKALPAPYRRLALRAAWANGSSRPRPRSIGGTGLALPRMSLNPADGRQALEGSWSGPGCPACAQKKIPYNELR